MYSRIKKKKKKENLNNGKARMQIFLFLLFQTADIISCFFTILRNRQTILKHAHKRKKNGTRVMLLHIH